MSTLALLLTQGVNALSQAALLFFLGVGLTLIFGIMRIVNFAHGTLYMLGAFIGYSVVRYTGSYWVALLLAPLAVGAIGTAFEGYVPKTRVLRHEAAIAMVNGLGFDRALRAITLDAARILGIQDRFGTIEVGKAADLVLYDGDPFEYATHVTNTIIDGRVIYDRAEYLKLPFSRRALPLTGDGVGCCLGIW